MFLNRPKETSVDGGTLKLSRAFYKSKFLYFKFRTSMALTYIHLVNIFPTSTVLVHIQGLRKIRNINGSLRALVTYFQRKVGRWCFNDVYKIQILSGQYLECLKRRILKSIRIEIFGARSWK